MTTFIIAFFGFTALQLVLGSPIFYFTWRSGRRAIARRFLQSAIVVGAICAVFSASSERLVNQCREANNLQCFDYGSAGIQLLFVTGFVGTAWFKAYIVSQQ